jgi:WD40 repeat protein
VTVAFDAWKDGKVAPSGGEVEVVAPPPTLRPEAVSPRLRASLIHPNRDGVLHGLRCSPDGKRMIAGDYPGGIVQVWDAGSGTQLTKIETGYGYRGSSDYFWVSPDWRTVYVSRSQRKATRFEKDGRKLLRWEFGGDVRAWDLDTGQPRRTFQHTPPRGIEGMVLSPDGSTFATFEELSGESDHGPGHAASLWDVKSGRPRALPADIDYWSVYAPDGRTLAAPAGAGAGLPATIRLLDVATARERVTIPVPLKGVRVCYMQFSPDGKLLVGQVRDERRTGRHWLKFWEAATGREVASFEGEPRDVFLWMAFSPDGRTLAVTNNARAGQGKLFLFDVVGRRLAKTVLLGAKAGPRQPAFSPDGRWLAVPTQVLPLGRLAREPRAEEVPQPRIHLVEVSTGVVRETLVSPPGFAASACFSPDGRTLATGGLGNVLLWDLSRPPGEATHAGGGPSR